MASIGVWQPSVLLHVPLRGPCWNDVQGWRDVPSTQRGGERHLQLYANFRRARVIAKKYKLCGVSKIIVSSESIMIEKCKITKCIFSHHLRYMGASSASQVEISTSHVRLWRNTCAATELPPRCLPPSVALARQHVAARCALGHGNLRPATLGMDHYAPRFVDGCAVFENLSPTMSSWTCGMVSFTICSTLTETGTSTVRRFASRCAAGM